MASSLLVVAKPRAPSSILHDSKPWVHTRQNPLGALFFDFADGGKRKVQGLQGVLWGLLVVVVSARRRDKSRNRRSLD